ncbi:hypothetical protein V5O48_017736 [Marasmius crinis-equi]|uniref:GATA-type domain-containing protein n=1 Tax=Marasmius crinis-equi TaxID=585013 RepID=A0ABR3EN41_9AGAR
MEFYPQTDSAPRTPSPLDNALESFAYNAKPLPTMAPSIYEEDNTNYIVHPHHHQQQQQQYWHPPSPPQRSSSAGSGNGSLLSELYDPEPLEPVQEWQQSPPQQQHHHQPRRATFPYVRQDHQPTSSSSSSSASPSPNPYGEIPLTAEPDAAVKTEDQQYLLPNDDSYSSYNAYPQPNVYPHPQHGYLQHQHQQHHPMHHPQHPHHPHSHHMQLPHPHPPPMHGMPIGMPGMPQNMVGISHPVQHTDDAASKETQFLRRRCFNCHTTEPPSWRRSTLNPGKIVCNKCGLYERTHLRPRPLRFDELRAGNKQRKNGSHASPPAKKLVLGTPTGPAVRRRTSVSSVVSGHGSDWEDNGGSLSSSSVASSPSPTTPPNL